MQPSAQLAARSQIYKFLAQAYRSPDAGLLDEDMFTSVKLSIENLGGSTCELERMVSYLTSQTDMVGLSIEFTRLFRGPVRAEVYPYESMYIDGEIMGKSALDVLKRYQEAGVEVSDDFKDLPDHICAEAEFMHYLFIRSLHALLEGEESEATRFYSMQQSFFGDHLVRWAPQFSDRILATSASPFYTGLARLMREFVQREAASDKLP